MPPELDASLVVSAGKMPRANRLVQFSHTISRIAAMTRA
jgi:hypothetical protein